MKKAKFLVILGLLVVATMVGCQKQPVPVPDPAPPVIPPEAKLVCLFFDDCWQNQYDVALPILLEHDFKATFGVITGFIGTGQDFWEYMGEKELNELAECGMDIAGHTKTHPHLVTGNLTDEQLREEIIDSKKHLEGLGFKVRTLVYPYYEWDERVIGYVKEAGYVCARGGWPEEGAYDLTTTDPEARYHIFANPIVSENFEVFKSIVGQASRYSVVCLVYHFISDTGPEETSTPVKNFCDQMRYLKEAGFTVVLLPDLFD